MKKVIIKSISICTVIVVMLTIFLFSAQNGIESAQLSNAVEDYLLQELSVDEIVVTHLPIRKLAHILLYTILSISVVIMLEVFEAVSSLFDAFVICLVYAILDEYHQSFVPGRGSLLTDVLIDTDGILLGLLISCIGMLIYAIIYNVVIAFSHDE